MYKLNKILIISLSMFIFSCNFNQPKSQGEVGTVFFNRCTNLNSNVDPESAKAICSCSYLIVGGKFANGNGQDNIDNFSRQLNFGLLDNEIRESLKMCGSPNNN